MDILESTYTPRQPFTIEDALEQVKQNITSWPQFKKNPSVYHKAVINQLEQINKDTFTFTHEIELQTGLTNKEKLKLYEDLRLHLLSRRNLKNEVQFISTKWKALMHLISFQIMMEDESNETTDTREVDCN